MPDETPKRAATVRAYCCPTSLHIDLVDETGSVLAAATLSHDDACTLVQCIYEQSSQRSIPTAKNMKA